MALDTTDTIKGIRYNKVAFPLDDGKDMLQARVDATNSCANLFYYYSGAELDISRLDTSNVTDMRYMFNSCSNLVSVDVGNFNTSNVNNMNGVFYYCLKLELIHGIENWDTSKVTNMSQMFNDCAVIYSLDISHFNTEKVRDAGSMFANCKSLTSLNLPIFNKLTNINSMFFQCSAIQNIDLSNLNTASLVLVSQLFYKCENLVTIQGTLDLYSVTNNSNMFYNTYVLTGVTLKNIRKSLQIGSGTSYGHLWELTYLINAIKELWDLSSGSQQTLTIGSANLEKIANTYVKLITPTAEQIEADPYINNKLPCELCESTDEGAMTLTAYAGLKNWGLA